MSQIAPHTQLDRSLSPPNAQWFSTRLLLLAAICFVLGCIALPVDLPFSSLFVAHGGPFADECRSWLRRWFSNGEPFGNGAGVALIGLVVFAVARQRRRFVVRLMTCVYLSGMTTNVLKMLVARTRPRIYFDHTANAFAGNVLDSFGGWLPLARLGHEAQSFPSGHTATAVALAVGLGWRYPHARWVFVLLATMAASQRIVFGHHYLSDTFWGAAVAMAVGAVNYSRGGVGGWFDRFEEPKRAGTIKGETNFQLSAESQAA